MSSENLMPPIVPTYYQAFVRGNSLTITFTMPKFNLDKTVRMIQVSIREQRSNASIFDKSEIYNYDFTNLNPDSNGVYSFSISSGKFEGDKIYKVQIRLSEEREEGKLGNVSNMNWINSNLDKLSEWTNVVLVKCLSSEPSITYKINSGFNINIDGTIKFDNDTETLKSYQIIIRYSDNSIPSEDSGIVIPTNRNQIHYSSKANLVGKSGTYTIVIKYITSSNYYGSVSTDSKPIPIRSKIQEQILEAIPCYDTLNEEDENIIGQNLIAGTVKLNITKITTTPINGAMIARTSDKTGFHEWEVLFENVNINNVAKTFFDKTAEPGVMYRYGIITDTQYVLSAPVVLNLEHSYLVNNNGLLRLKLNPSIGSYKINKAQTVTQTIGGKYPYVRSSGDMYYRTFSISGMIASFMGFRDGEGNDIRESLFPKDSDGNNVEKQLKEFSSHLSNHTLFRFEDDIATHISGISNDLDYYTEKRFRDKVVEFLNSNEAILFKSATEGNILVKLSDVTLAPNQQLGRKIYTFSANAVEIADPTLDNFDLYNIQTIKIA